MVSFLMGIYDTSCEYGFKRLHEFGPGGLGMSVGECSPQWSVYAIHHHENTRFPHLKAVILSGVTGNDQKIFQGELLPNGHTARADLSGSYRRL
jgi:hypothetical protein